MINAMAIVKHVNHNDRYIYCILDILKFRFESVFLLLKQTFVCYDNKAKVIADTAVKLLPPSQFYFLNDLFY